MKTKKYTIKVDGLEIRDICLPATSIHKLNEIRREEAEKLGISAEGIKILPKVPTKLGTQEGVVLKAMQRRKALLIDTNNYVILKQITGIVHNSTMADLLTDLEIKGYVERKGPGMDNIFITDKGMAA